MTPQEVLQGWLPSIPSNLSITPLTPTQHTLKTRTSIPAKTNVLTIPDQYTITSTTSLSNPLIQKALSEFPAPPPTTPTQAAILLFLLVSRNDPFYQPYFQALPQRIITATTSNSTNAVYGTPLYHLSLALRHELDILFLQWFAQLKAVYPEFAHVEREQFLYAHAILESRAVGVGKISVSDDSKNDNTDSEETLLLPVIDFCNHSTTPNCHLTPSDSSLALVTNRDIIPGEQLSICYGKLSNLLLLLHWGFAIPDNPFDEVLLRLEEPDDVARDIVLSVLVGELDFVLTINDPLPKLLVRAVRILVVADITNGVKRNFDIPLRNEESRVVQVLRELVDSLRCTERDDVSDDENCVEEQQFEKFCDVYREGIERILDAAEVQIAQIEACIPT